jgi:Matrixin
VSEFAAVVPTPTFAVEAAAPVIGYEDGPAEDDQAGANAAPAASVTTPTTARRRTTTSTTAPKTSATNSATQAASNDPVEQSTGAFALHRNADGSVVRWNPCAPITWKANLALAPAGALEEMGTAVSRLAEATGMTFVYGGTTSIVPSEAWLHGKSDPRTIVVAWTAKADTDLMAENADGEGGWYEQGSSKDGETWTWQIVRGYVLMDVAGTAEYAPGFGDGVTRGALLMHELAHAVGLSHVDDKSQLMYSTLSRSTAARYASGDLAGLAEVGTGAGCIG